MQPVLDFQTDAGVMGPLTHLPFAGESDMGATTIVLPVRVEE